MELLKIIVYVLGDSVVKKLNGCLLTKKIKHRHLVLKYGAKINCMAEHLTPTLREVNPGHIILHAGVNGLKVDKTSSQIAKDIAISLKNNENIVAVSYFVPRLDELNSKVNEINNRLVLMCKKRNIPS